MQPSTGYCNQVVKIVVPYCTVYFRSTSFEAYLGQTLLLGVAGGAQARGEPCPRGVQGFRKYFLPPLINSFKFLLQRQRENPVHVVAGFPQISPAASDQFYLIPSAEAEGEPCHVVAGFPLPLINSMKFLPQRQRENPVLVVSRVSANIPCHL
jgi:hypothetical protein